MKTKSINYQIIGVVETPFKEKFGVPRSAGLAPLISGKIRIFSEYSDPEAIRGLDSFSHLWLLFDFHMNTSEKWSPCIRPPRLGGNEKIGVYASRSPNRPNPIGLSCVAFSNPRFESGEILIDISGPDLVDGTPLLDIKPYSPEADCFPTASSGWPAKASAIPNYPVTFAPQASAPLNLQEQIISYLSMDPRPSYKSKKDDEKIYANKFHDYDIQWKIENKEVTVLKIIPCA